MLSSYNEYNLKLTFTERSSFLPTPSDPISYEADNGDIEVDGSAMVFVCVCVCVFTLTCCTRIWRDVGGGVCVSVYFNLLYTNMKGRGREVCVC